ncbi:hypothetical protein A9179_07935 [Pseudomonas alcaligenes]|uniref:DUF2167 domain-containing protein n=1 Tax=Aquipseudomonas alcaligenes TaxID=43263 RepID=A0ABR7S0G3_AQUAC|nr:DUF2167 domain-containing protein [Pseudomonas alcaligenes]MBC9250202.1 hypothetical protein [Pseudomonas alcaligenes]
MSIKELILAGLLASAIPFAHATAPAAEQTESEPTASEQVLDEETVSEEEPTDEGMSEDEFVASLHFQKGKIVLGDNLATLNLPEQFVFLDGEEAERLLVEAWGNPPDSELPLGMILPAGVSPLAQESWAVTVEYEESGYVSDEDAADIDYDEMLQDLKDETKEDNKWRTENDYEPVELIGWASAPRYDEKGKKLHWAKELKFGDSEVNTLNYNIRVLGRKGVLVLNFIANMDQLPQIEQSVPAVLAMTEFNEGHRYAEFDPDIDKVAAYGLGALIAGKLAAKAGLFAAALLLLKKLWIVPVLVFGWIAKRLGGKKKAAQPQADEPLQESTAAPGDTAKAEETPR